MCDFMKRTLGFTLLFSFGYSYYLCNQMGDTWKNATEHCKLLTTETLKELDLSELIKANVTEFWTSNIIEVAHAVEFKGCYIYSTGPPQDNPIPTVREINLVDCQKACLNNFAIDRFFGMRMQDDKCVCYTGDLNNFGPSNQSCFQNCSINSLEFCRDSKLIAFYKMKVYSSTTLQLPNCSANKCVARVNSTAYSTENCQKNLPYQCHGIKNGTFLNALKECGKELGRANNLSNSWKPVFFPMLDRIKNQWNGDANQLQMMICKSLKVDGNQIYIKERKCTDLLPYICKTDNVSATSTYLKTCSFQNRHTTSATTEKTVFSTKHGIHTSEVSNTVVGTSSTIKTIAFTTKNGIRMPNVPNRGVNTHTARNHIHHGPTTSNQFSTSSTTEPVSDVPNKWLIVGISCGVAVIVLTVTIIFIVRKRCTGMKQNEKGLGAVNLQTVSDNNEEQDVLYDENISPYSVSVSVNPTLVANQGNVVYAVVNKPKQTDNRNGDCYSLATPISSTPVERENNGGTAALYAEVNKVKKKTTKGAPENNTGNDINITESETASGYDDNKMMHTGCNNNKNVSAESELQPGNDVTYHVSTGTDYDHINFRGSKHTDELPVESDGLYDHAAVGHERGDDMYDGVQRDVEQHGTNDTYDHVSALR